MSHSHIITALADANMKYFERQQLLSITEKNDADTTATVFLQFFILCFYTAHFVLLHY